LQPLHHKVAVEEITLVLVKMVVQVVELDMEALVVVLEQ
jgi:hypothetical protein